MSTGRSVKVLGVVILLISLSALVSCGGGDNGTADPTTKPAGTSDGGPVVITIGNHTDLSTTPADAAAVMTMPLQDMARYFNDEGIIPGVEFKVVTYDAKYDTSLNEPGYLWLKAQGANLFFSPPPHTAADLKPLLEKDRMVLFSPSPSLEALDPPGWVFGVGNPPVEYAIYTFLNWVAENDPDFPQGRPAKIGGAFWDEDYSRSLLAAAEAYCQANPDQYEWVYGDLTEWSFAWGPQVEALKDCDYVIPNLVMGSFVRDYRQAGGQARFLGTGGHLTFIGEIERSELWDEIDGMFFIKGTLHWNDEGEVVNLIKDLLQRYRPDSAEAVRQAGVGYLTGQMDYIMFKLIRETVADVGAENCDSQALYDHAQSFSMVLDGCPHSFTETKRSSNDAVGIYEARAEDRDIFRTTPDWIPVVYEP